MANQSNIFTPTTPLCHWLKTKTLKSYFFLFEFRHILQKLKNMLGIYRNKKNKSRKNEENWKYQNKVKPSFFGKKENIIFPKMKQNKKKTNQIK